MVTTAKTSPETSVYHLPYRDPYTIRRPGGAPVRLLFSQMDQVLQACARRDKKPGDENNDRPTLDVAIVLPGNMREHGQSTDAQFQPALAVNARRMCDHLGLNFHIKSRVSWECDDRALSRNLPDNVLQQHHLGDLERYFPGVKPEECLRRLRARQAKLFKDTRDILRNYNLIVIGSPNVNQVMVNLCDILLTNYENLAELGMYLFPATGQSPLRLRRFNGTEWREYRDQNWEDRDIGWVHMLRNPWSSPEQPRFLIYVGGFHSQGVVAAMRKRVAMSSALVSLLGDKSLEPHQRAARLLHEPNPHEATDYRLGSDATPGSFVPAHIVRARVELPLHWLLAAPRPDLEMQSWTAARPSFEGNVEQYEAVV